MKDVVLEFHQIIFQVRLKCVQMYTSVIQHFGITKEGRGRKGGEKKGKEEGREGKEKEERREKEGKRRGEEGGEGEEGGKGNEETKSKSVLMIRSK